MLINTENRNNALIFLSPKFSFSKISIYNITMTMLYPTDWDVEKYYEDTEPEQHWDLRKQFMTTHKGKFSEEYLVALARTFTNIEFLGCSYPSALMVRIAELSKDVAKDYREVKKTKLQRTFITAKRAAENRYGGKKDDNKPGKSC